MEKKIRVYETKFVDEYTGKEFRHRQFLYFCPGCGYTHAVGLKSEGGNHDFNFDLEKPTFTPSLVHNFRQGQMCHSYITNGMIEFLSDCTHHLAGTKTELPEWKEEFKRM